jgi:hypothetical protein
MRSIRTSDTIRVSAILLAILAIYQLRLNTVAGLMVDDAWYVVLAKALASGEGFRLISSASTPIQPLYPPGFPAVLSLVMHFSPEFPQNVLLLKAVSIAAMIGVGALTYVYLHAHRQLSRELALLIATAVTISPAFVFLATSTVMSECFFTLCQLGAIVVVHRAGEALDERSGRNYAALAGVLAGGTMLVRSAGVALIVAAVLWLLKERRWMRTAWFAGIALACVLPWMVYARVNAPTPAEQALHGGAVVYEYVDQLSMRWAGAPVFGRITIRDLSDRILTNLVDIFARCVGGIFVPALFRTAGESGEEVISLTTRGMGATQTMSISLLLTGVALIGYVRTVRERLSVAEFLVPLTVAIVVLWPYWSFRFVLPLTPFLFFYLTKGLQLLSPRAASIALLSLIGLNVYDHGGYIVHARADGEVNWLAQAREVDALLEWINRGGLPDDGILVSTNPGLVYLRTGRNSIASDHPMQEWSTWEDRGVRYAAALYPVELPAGKHKVLYRSAGHLWVIQI